MTHKEFKKWVDDHSIGACSFETLKKKIQELEKSNANGTLFMEKEEADKDDWEKERTKIYAKYSVAQTDLNRIKAVIEDWDNENIDELAVATKISNILVGT